MENNKELVDFADKIITKEDFVKFLKLLLKDFQERRFEWENDNLERYLESLYGFTADLEGYLEKDQEIENPSWSLFATILLGGKVYE